MNCCLVPEEKKEAQEIGTGTSTSSDSSSNNNKNNNNNRTMQTATDTPVATFEKQDSLPRLPIPTLSSTLTRFIKAVTPLLTPSQLKETKSTVNDFLLNDGAKLQSLLEEYDAKAAADGTFGSYIEGTYTVLKCNVVFSFSFSPFFTFFCTKHHHCHLNLHLCFHHLSSLLPSSIPSPIPPLHLFRILERRLPRTRHERRSKPQPLLPPRGRCRCQNRQGSNITRGGTHF